MIDVTNKVMTYDENPRSSKGTPSDRPPPLLVHSHGTRTRMVVLEWPNGERLMVVADDLRRAIENAVNHDRRYATAGLRQLPRLPADPQSMRRGVRRDADPNDPLPATPSWARGRATRRTRRQRR